jgi:glycosyltransferase involved in cell wall biosynthesis
MTPPKGLLDHEAQAPAGNRAPAVEIVIPVRDEERDLDRSIRRLLDHLRTGFPFTARVTIADNGSADRTWAIAAALEQEFAGVRAVRLDEPGRGRALRAVWAASDAAVLAYMDVDLSTDLNALLPLVAPLLSGHSDLAIGTRLARGARVIRGAFLRRAVRVQGDPRGPGQAAAPADPGHRVVFRHRAARAGPAGRAAHP